jgi:hypothetical protein
MRVLVVSHFGVATTGDLHQPEFSNDSRVVNKKNGELFMSSSDQSSHPENLSLGASAQEFLDYCAAEKERRLNSGEAFDEEIFDQAIQMIMNKLRVLADEGWS